MYNLTVEGAHTFFVGQDRWLVHNAKFCNSPAESPVWKELDNFKGKLRKVVLEEIHNITNGIIDTGVLKYTIKKEDIWGV